MFELLCDVIQDVNAIKDADKRSAALEQLARTCRVVALAKRQDDSNFSELMSNITGYSYGEPGTQPGVVG